MIATALLRQELLIEPYRGPGAYGPHYDVGVTVAGRVVPHRRVTRDAGGADVVVDATATLRPSVLVPVESRVTVGGATYTVVGASGGVDVTGRACTTRLLLAAPHPAAES